MKKTLITLVIACFCLSLGAQTRSDSILVVKKAMGTAFQKDGMYLTPRQLTDLSRNYPDALSEMKKAKANLGAMSVFSYAGGFMIGWPIGTALAGGKANWTLAGVGAAFVVLSIPFANGYTNHAKNAVRIINSHRGISMLPQPQYRLGFTGSGIGLQLRF